MASPTGSHMAPERMTETQWEAQLRPRGMRGVRLPFVKVNHRPGTNAGH